MDFALIGLILLIIVLVMAAFRAISLLWTARMPVIFVAAALILYVAFPFDVLKHLPPFWVINGGDMARGDVAKEMEAEDPTHRCRGLCVVPILGKEIQTSRLDPIPIEINSPAPVCKKALGPMFGNDGRKIGSMCEQQDGSVRFIPD